MACRRRRIETTCAHCGKALILQLNVINPNGNFCSKPCAYAHRQKHPDQTCEQCGTTFRPIARGTIARFCSANCYTSYRIGLPPEQRNAMISAAQAKVRGMKRSHDDLCKRARTKQERAQLSGDESEIMAAFDAAGLHPIPLYAVEKFNIDFAFPDAMLAVEYHGGNWHNSTAKRAQDERKAAFLNERGWTLLVFPRLGKQSAGEIAEQVRGRLNHQTLSPTKIPETAKTQFG
jgi:very-short-patch-repair endonuclease